MVKGSDDRTREPRNARRSSPLERSGPFGRNDAADDAGKKSDAIRAKIDRTRAELDQTVDALQERLDPAPMVQEALDAARETLAEAGRRFFELVRANPVPAALVAVGLVWLVAGYARQAPGPKDDPIRVRSLKPRRSSRLKADDQFFTPSGNRSMSWPR